ncbi:MAG: homoserine dehydrogenase [Ruminococcaceae bacterium]|nr:homoserine dehydrogenase [Oscillospiraceae bacterium]
MVHIAILGLGVVGSGTADLITQNKDLIKERFGEEVNIKYILDIKDKPESPYSDKIIHDYNVILEDPEVTVVAEVMGGSHPAFEFSMQALSKGKNVVTSNKEVVSNFGDQLLKAASDNNVSYLFEASVGGGIPVLRPLSTDLSANNIKEIVGILNGTTNYILTKMKKEGESFENALAEAQKNGYAEANPSADIDGIDTCRKISILTAIAYGKLINPQSIHTEGIAGIRREDVEAIERTGACIKLLGKSVMTENKEVYVMTAPFVIGNENPLASVDDVFNAVTVKGDFVGDVTFYGRGAGAYPTASAVCGDIMNIISGATANLNIKPWQASDEMFMSDFSYFACKRYLSFADTDKNAAQVIFGDVEMIQEGSEISFITGSITENELSDKVMRLCSSGARLCAHIRVL